jgi:pimeloyl-ACP methyl ester carboxylesterase
MAESGKRQRRLSDGYSFAGFRARATVRGVFGDPNVRILRLDRRSKKNGLRSPVRASPTAERVFSKVLDYLATRKEIDASRIVLHGVSFGGYWAAKLAVVEKARLKAVSAQSPAVHDTFQPEYLKNRISGNREYLFDYVPVQIAVFEGVSTVEDLVATYPKMSLLAQGLLGKPTPPMLIVGGALDTQVPISDAYRLLSAGDAPKDAWINLQAAISAGSPRSGRTRSSSKRLLLRISCDGPQTLKPVSGRS